MKRNVVYIWPLFLAVAFGSVSAPPLLGQEAKSGRGAEVLTLESAVGLALKNSPQLAAAGHQIGSAEGRADQSRLWPNPDLLLSADDWLTSDGGFNDAKKLVGVEQTVPFPGKKRLDGQIGRLGVRSTEAEYNLKRVELVRDVKVAFFQVLAAERLKEVARELVRVAESSAAIAHKRVQAGAAADQEELRAEIPLEEARTRLASFERELEAARQNLAITMGCPDLKTAALQGSLVETANLALLNEGPEKWLAKHPSVAAARAVWARAEAELQRARLEPYPDVTLGAAGGEEAGGAGSMVQFTLRFPMPLIDRSKGRKKEGQANLRAAEAEIVYTEQRLLRDWGTASRRLKTAAEQAATYRDRILPKADRAWHLVQRGFEEGKFGFMDMLDTQHTAAEARLVFLQTVLELNIAQAEVEAFLSRVPTELSQAQTSQSQTPH